MEVFEIISSQSRPSPSRNASIRAKLARDHQWSLEDASLRNVERSQPRPSTFGPFPALSGCCTLIRRVLTSALWCHRPRDSTGGGQKACASDAPPGISGQLRVDPLDLLMTKTMSQHLLEGICSLEATTGR